MLSAPHRPALAVPSALRTVVPEALLGAAAGIVAGILLDSDSAVIAVLLALLGALLAVALPAWRRHGRAAPARPRHPAAEPTTTLALPPRGRSSPPGWYPDPDPIEGSDGVRRLWDGEAWTEHRWAPRP